MFRATKHSTSDTIPAPRVVTSSASFVSGFAEKLSRSAVPPFPNKTTSLGLAGGPI